MKPLSLEKRYFCTDRKQYPLSLDEVPAHPEPMTHRTETDKKWLLQEDPNADDNNSQWSLSLPTTLGTGFPGSLGKPLALGRLLYFCKLLYRGSALQMYYANAQCTQAHSVPVPSVCMVAPAYQKHSREFKITNTRRPMVYFSLLSWKETTTWADAHGRAPQPIHKVLLLQGALHLTQPSSGWHRCILWDIKGGNTTKPSR